ncbi:MAG: DUF6468 domain-containing protein [Rhodospirillaceae bacterium]
MTFALVLDLVIVALLVPTIIFAVVLNNRLAVLRKNREELSRLVAAFNEATVRAESGIPRLRKTSEDSARALQEQVERARTLRDDLAFMIERAEGMAARLENAVRHGRVAEGKIAERAGHVPPAAMDIESAAAVADRIKSQFLPEDRSPLLGAGRLDLRADRQTEMVPAGVPNRFTDRLPDGLLENLPDRLAERVVTPDAGLVAVPPTAKGPVAVSTSASPPSPASTPLSAPAGSAARASRPAPRGAAPAGGSLGAALARDGGASVAAALSGEDDGRSEAERELLRALQSVR